MTPRSEAPGTDPFAGRDSLREVVSNLPHRPGVYRMIAAEGCVLYVGKARDLRKRVASYFQKTSSLQPRIQVMVAQIETVETTVARSESEALLLENNLIKALTPRYNILYRDDKSYPYLMLTGHAYPKLGFHRGALDKPHRYFGPFSSASALRESIQLMQKVFRLRTCEDTVFSNRSRPCLLHQIRRCTAPCVKLIDEARYAEDVRDAELFLRGRDDEVMQRLEQRMASAAQGQCYEDAASFRDQIQALRTVRQRQFVSGDERLDADVVALVMHGGALCVNLVSIRNGMHRGDKCFFPEHAEGYDAPQALEAFIAQHYINRDVPPLIVLNHELDTDVLASALSEQAGREITLTTRTSGERRVWVDMAQTNARLALEQRLSMQSTQEARLTALHQALGLPASVQRIECFDISHTLGEATVASCVVYDKGSMQNSQYRRYNIAQAKAGDDYAAMREVLDRRYRKIVGGEGVLPDFILIDGGKGQVSSACEVMNELGLSEIPLAGVAKGEERKAGMEQLVIPGRQDSVRLTPDHPGLHLIQQIRDEAHRFAIEGHRGRRAKPRRTSTMEGIPGVGPKRRQKLLSHFGGLRGIAAASLDELTQVEGINRALAERIYAELH